MVSSPEEVLSLTADDVRLFWRCTKPADGLRERQMVLAREAAAAAGYDRVDITANIHATTKGGTRRDKPHLTVEFWSDRYGSRLTCTTHINVHVWNPTYQQWYKYPFPRPDDFNYDNVYQDGNIRFHRGIPRALAEEEIAARQQEQQQQEGQQAQAGDTEAAAADATVWADGWYADPWDSTGALERWYSAGEWTQHTRAKGVAQT